MKKIIYIMFALGLFVGCEKDFQEINTDPEVGVPPPETLFTYVQKSIGTYKGGGEWYHENHQK